MRTVSLILAIALASGSAWAGTLQDVREAAERSDPQWLAAQRTWKADQQIRTQARGALLPNITASYSHMRNWNKYEMSGAKEAEFDRITTGVQLVQPLFRLDAWYGYKQARAVVNASDAQFAQDQQDFLLRVASNYVDVLRTWEGLQFALANEKAIGSQLEQTQERYNVGLVPITDVQQAQSIYDNAKVTLIAARTQFEIARDQLQVLTGQEWLAIDRLKEDLPMDGVTPADPAQWIALAQEKNPQLEAARLGAEVQHQNARVKGSTMLPRVEIVGGYQHQHNIPRNDEAKGGGALGMMSGYDIDTQGKNIGLQVTVPLFMGGALNSQRKQAVLQAQAADSTYELAFRNISHAARSQFRLVQTNAESIKAGAQAIKSAETALDAAREGYKVGTNTIIDVLAAESRLFEAQQAYANARYNYIIDSLSLKATAGVLSAADLDEVDSWLDSNSAIDLAAAP